MERVVPILLSVGAGVAIAVVCAFCFTVPDKIADYLRRRYLRSGKWARKWPFASMVLKEEYPVYLRWIGLAGFFCTLIWLGLVLQQVSK